MTNWLITQYPDRFAAAASGAGIANWTSDYANSDIPRTKETEFWGPPSDPKARETMIRQSPITYAEPRHALRRSSSTARSTTACRSQRDEQLYVAIKKQERAGEDDPVRRPAAAGSRARGTMFTECSTSARGLTSM